jgi:hypothetical protein
MSYRGDGYGAPYGPAGAGAGEQQNRPQGGSVGAARERLQAEREQRERRQQEPSPGAYNYPLPVRGDSAASQQSPSTLPRRPQPTDPTLGYAPPTGIPRSTAQQQWPLPVRTTSNTGFGAPSTQGQPVTRGMLPSQRGPPPPHPPSFLDTDKDTMSPSTPQPSQSAQWQDGDHLSPPYGSPNLSRPLTNSSYASDSSSIGTIPDFPVPNLQIPPPVRRNNQLIGPPPSARRGPSSYYSQISYVSPIVEESTDVRASVGSFASSNVFPTDVPDFYLEDASDDDDVVNRPTPGNSDSTSVPNNGSGLVRQASLGKRTKPTLTTIKSGDAVRPNMSANAPGAIASAQAPQTAANSNYAAIRSQMTSPLGAGSILLDPSSSSSSSQESLQKQALRSHASAESLNMKSPSSYELLAAARSRTPPAPNAYYPSTRTAPSSPLVPLDSRVEHILGGLEKGGALSPVGSKEFRDAKKGSLADRVGSRRPPRLNVDAVRDAEARGSLTSLPDLIKRATRLASNLDRGKTASRLGFEWLDYEKGDRSRDSGGAGNNPSRQKNRRSTTLSGMLSAFPPPARSIPGSPKTHWPQSGTGSAKSLNPREREQNQRRRKDGGRRICGLRIWPFVFLVLFFLTLIVAAIVIPVVLIVLPKKNSTPTASAGATSACQSKSACLNGGGSVALPGGTCGCLCTNGFTGSQCQTASDAGCSSMAVAGVKDASVGSQIPALIGAAGTNYSIPLDSTSLLSLFAVTNMTCGSENALVTLTGSSNSKRSEEEAFAALRRFQERADTNPDGSSATVTSNGIAIAGTTPTQTTTPPASATSAVTISTGSSAPGTNATSRDFARIGILFVLQESRQLNVAIGAQEVLSSYMNQAAKQGSSMTLAHNVTLGSGYSIDLWYWTVTLSNGTVYGNGFNGSATALTLS